MHISVYHIIQYAYTVCIMYVIICNILIYMYNVYCILSSYTSKFLAYVNHFNTIYSWKTSKEYLNNKFVLTNKKFKYIYNNMIM